MKNVNEMSRKELVAAAKEIGIAKAHTTKSEVLIEELTMHLQAQAEKAAPTPEVNDETSGTVLILRRWEKEAD